MSVSRIHQLVCSGHVTPRDGAMLLELRRQLAWRRQPLAVRVLAFLAALLLSACAHRGPLDAPMPRVSSTAISSPRTCTLPPVPDMPVVVGYPSATTIYVTVDDLAAMTRATLAVTEWLKAAERCFK